MEPLLIVFCPIFTQGQECDSLSSIWPTGCILATTSATVLLIKPIPGSKPSLSCSSLSHAASGWLGGLTKKMSFLMPMGGGSALETVSTNFSNMFSNMPVSSRYIKYRQLRFCTNLILFTITEKSQSSNSIIKRRPCTTRTQEFHGLCSGWKFISNLERDLTPAKLSL